MAEEDARIGELREALEEGKTDQEVAELLQGLGGKDAIIYGGMCFDDDFAKAHFLINACLLNAAKLTDEIVKRKELLKACCKSEEQQMAFLFAMELMIVKEKRRGIKKYDDILRKLWEQDIISEDQMDAWYRKEDGLKQHYPDFQLDDAIDCRKAGWKFIDWVQQGEDDDEEEDD